VGLTRLPYRSLERLIAAHLSLEEDQDTALLSKKLRAAKRRGHLTVGELEAVCRWKSARAIRHIRANSRRRVQVATRAALATRSEERRLTALLQLAGVSIPMASALLTLVDPRRYGVIDIRVWQLLHAMGAVSDKPRGVAFSPRHWLQFLAILRRHSSRLRVGARDIERALFDAHRIHQERTLYE
jgi:hypothetical protein